MKVGAVIYKANRIAAIKSKHEARKSQVPRILNANHPPLPACPRCQRAFRARISLVGHLRTRCVTNLTSTSPSTLTPDAISTPTGAPVTANHTVAAPPQPLHRPQRPVSPPLPHLHAFSPPMGRRLMSHRLLSSQSTLPPPRDMGSVHTCSYCDRTFTSHIGLVGHLRILPTETG
ncbi:hypothetical protein SprV_0401457600 [Sparganum proliferum]